MIKLELQDIVITNITDILTVPRAKGTDGRIDGRKSHGLSFCLDGQITYFHNGQAIVSEPGYAVYLPKSASYTSCTDRSGHFPLINFQSAQPLSDTIVVIPLKNQEKYIAQFESMRHTALLPHSKLKLMEQFYGMLATLTVDMNKNSASLSPAIEYLEANLHDPQLSNALLASQLGFSEVHFRRQFTDIYGEPPHRYILNLRMRRAKQLLTDGMLTVSAIAEQCGFSSVYHFSRAFKQAIGLSPTAYAKQNHQTKL